MHKQCVGGRAVTSIYLKQDRVGGTQGNCTVIMHDISLGQVVFWFGEIRAKRYLDTPGLANQTVLRTRCLPSCIRAFSSPPDVDLYPVHMRSSARCGSAHGNNGKALLDIHCGGSGPQATPNVVFHRSWKISILIQRSRRVSSPECIRTSTTPLPEMRCGCFRCG